MTNKGKKMTKSTKSKSKSKPRHVLVGNERHGLYIGLTSATDAEIVSSRSVRLDQCRHVCYWYTAVNGGITTLAQDGPGGPKVGECRIGRPATSALLTGVVNVYDLTPAAVAAFAAVVPS